MSRWGSGELGSLLKRASGPGESADVDPAELAAQVGPGPAGRVLGGAGQEESEPAEDDVGADAVLAPVAGRPEVDDLLHVAPALNFQELLVAQGDVLRGQLRVGGAQQVLPIEVLLGLRPGRVDPEQAAGGGAQVAAQPGPRRDHAAELRALVSAELAGLTDHLLETGDHAAADGGVALGGLGVEADDEPLVIGDPHFLDLQVPRDVLVAALSRQGGLRVGGAGAELFPMM